MKLTLRLRIVLTIIPMLLLLAAVGSAGILLLDHLSHQIDGILRENYRSINYMDQINESLERIDASFHFALEDQLTLARSQYRSSWQVYQDNLAFEQGNITVTGERELVDQLAHLTDQYRRQGDAFLISDLKDQHSVSAYHGPGGLLDTFGQIKKVSSDIRSMNQKHMEEAGQDAQRTARFSVTVLSCCLIGAGFLAVLLTLQMIRTVLYPIRTVTDIAREISTGNLDQVMPVVSNDEVGQLASAFNLMARHLREYRQSQMDQLLRAQQTSQATINSFPDPVLVIDCSGNVQMANPAARRMLGVTSVPTGQLSSSFWKPPEALRQPLADALSGQRNYLPESFECTITLNSKEAEIAVLPRILTIRDQNANTLGAAIVLQDVTRLRLLDQVKNNLVATASHELKTPLTGVRLAIHLLLEESVGVLTPKQTELLLDARENSERLLGVVNSLLDLARLEQGSHQLDLHRNSPRDILQNAADAVRARAQDKNIELVLDVPDVLPQVNVDTERFGHAIGNLLDNALAYTDRGGTITLSALSENDSVIISVVDTGCGIPAEHVTHIFEKFFRVPGQDRGAGTGLGLAIVHEIMTAHGGTISCESQVGVGTTFRLRLPIALDQTSEVVEVSSTASREKQTN